MSILRRVAVAGMVLLSTMVFASVASAGIVVSIDKSAQRMTVTVDGVKKYYWPVSTGAKGYTTPSGSYTTFRMEKEHYSKEWDDAPMPYSIFFTRSGIAVHGTKSKGLGTAASHGCVRLSVENAATLWDLVATRPLYSTTVQVNGSIPQNGQRVAKR